MLKQVIEIFDLLDDGRITGNKVTEKFSCYENVEAKCNTITGELGTTDSIEILIKGSNGKSVGGNARTIGIIGRLGGIGARPKYKGLVSDGDGAVAAIAVALKLSEMSLREDVLDGDVIITTHICPDAPTEPHDPVDFMGSTIDMNQMNETEVKEDMDAILSIDTTKGNNVLNYKGYAISPTIKEGYILKVSEDILNCVEVSSGKKANVFPVSQLDITPYSNDMYHINSILQPAVSTKAPVVGIAITAETAVPGCSTGASDEYDITAACRFAIEVCKGYTSNQFNFYDEKEYKQIIELYGSNEHFQK
ncbi:MAG: DUF1177 domain-containing protein [Mycoplasmatales bacterium]